jgi:hypothetical protein
VTDEPHARDQFPYPTGDVVAVFLDEAAFSAAREHLEQEGFAPGDCLILHGEGDAEQVDVSGERHGWAGSIIRRLQDVITDEGSHARRYAEHLRAGHYVVAVAVGDDEDAKVRAAQALAAAHADSLTYYHPHYIEDLGTGS